MKVAHRSFLAFAAALPALVAGHGGYDDDPADEDRQDFLTSHMRDEHHLHGFDLASAFFLHDLNRDNILEPEEILKLYGVDHETAVDHSDSTDQHDTKAERVLREVMAKLDLNRDGIITKTEFVNAGKDGLPRFDDILGLGHHYDEEGEYFLHHEELYHSTPETQTEEAYSHPEDVRHFAQHEAIEAQEEELARKAQGLPPLADDPHADQQVLAAAAAADAARAGRVAAARSQAAKFAGVKEEAGRRGEWGQDGKGFRRAKDTADRLRINVPYKYKVKKSFWGEF
jgi:hypothetical protein